MYQDYGVDLKDIMTAVQCPDCLRKFAVRLSTNYLVRHKGEAGALGHLFVMCQVERIAEIKEKEKGILEDGYRSLTRYFSRH